MRIPPAVGKRCADAPGRIGSTAELKPARQSEIVLDGSTSASIRT
jgi:hypothetical protein